jgi:hypothetical protein
MLPAELSRTAVDLPPEDRLELARQLVESVVTPASLTKAVNEGVKRLADVLSGNVLALSEDENRAALTALECHLKLLP